MLFVLASLMRLDQMIRLEPEFPRGRKAALTGAMQEDVPFLKARWSVSPNIFWACCEHAPYGALVNPFG